MARIKWKKDQMLGIFSSFWWDTDSDHIQNTLKILACKVNESINPIYYKCLKFWETMAEKLEIVQVVGGYNATFLAHGCLHLFLANF